MKHRILKIGEKLKKGDEYKGDHKENRKFGPEKWDSIIGWEIGEKLNERIINTFIYRRKVSS